jgi:hypothetical protein
MYADTPKAAAKDTATSTQRRALTGRGSA